MREIKLKVVTISNVDNCLIEISEPMSVKKVGDYIAERIDKDCVERYEYIQFTGLKDKNGKEIYEGDLLIFQGDRDAMFEVFYNDIYGKFSCCRTHYLGSRCGGYVPEIEDKKFEIVGNIYENQELLTNN